MDVFTGMSYDGSTSKDNDDEVPYWGQNVNRCICCGRIIPEGRQVCPICERERWRDK